MADDWGDFPDFLINVAACFVDHGSSSQENINISIFFIMMRLQCKNFG